MPTGFRKEVLPQRHFGSKLRNTAPSCRNHHSNHPLLHGGLKIDENSAVVGWGSKPVLGLYAAEQVAIFF